MIDLVLCYTLRQKIQSDGARCLHRPAVQAYFAGSLQAFAEGGAFSFSAKFAIDNTAVIEGFQNSLKTAQVLRIFGNTIGRSRA